MSWKEFELAECCEIVNGSTPSRNKPEYWDGEIDWFTPKDLSEIQNKGKYLDEAPEKITELGYKSCSTTMIPARSLMFTSRAPIGHIAINKRSACTNQGFKNLVPKKHVDVEYLYYVIKKLTPQLQDLGNGATFKEISKASISKFKIPLPPLAEQKKIAALLDAADSLRQKDKALVAKYDELTQSLFLEMFGDPVRNEKGWEVLDFSKVAKNENSKREPIKQTDRDDRDGEFPYYGATGVIDYLDDYKFDGEYLLVAEDGKNLLFRKKNNAFLARGKFWVNNHAHILSFNDHCNLYYLLFFLNSIDFGPYISGIDQIKLNKASLDRIPVPVPPLTLQNQFAERVQLIEKQKSLAQVGLKKSEELFEGLLGKVFAKN